MRRRDKEILDWVITIIILSVLIGAVILTTGCTTTLPAVDSTFIRT